MKTKNAKIAVTDGYQWYTVKVLFDTDSTKTLKRYFIVTYTKTFLPNFGLHQF